MSARAREQRRIAPRSGLDADRLAAERARARDLDRELSISRRGVLARDEHRCQYCGARAETLDHVVPRSRGGGHTWDNVVAACRPCNVHKADRLLPDTRLELRRPPVVPRRTAWVTVLVEQVPEAWRPWLPAAA